MIRTVLVTGSEGFIGRALCAALESDGVRVLKLSRSLGHDILNEGMFSSFRDTGVEAVVHLAGKSFVPESWKDPEGFEKSNVGGTRKVIEFCLQENACLLQMSSYVYGNPTYLPIDEDHPVQAFNPYARSKVLAEDAVKAEAGLNFTIVRPFNIYGPGQDPKYLIAQIVRDYLQRGEVVVQTLKPKRDYLFIADLVSALQLLISRPFQGEIHNLGYGTSHSVEEVINVMEKVVGQSIPRRDLGLGRENEVMDVVASCRLTRQSIWRPTTSLYEGLRACLVEGRDRIARP